MTELMPAVEREGQGRIGRYTNLTLLGQGGMGAVYRARDPELDRLVAIKVMLDATPDFVARFRREAQAIARLTHAHVVQVFDFGVDEQGNPYFVMELIDGTPLDRIVRERGRLDAREAVRLIRQAAEGLQAAHRAGIVHRDVKPSNLIVDGSGNIKLVDFGIARVQAPSGVQALTGAAALMGTPGYMAPEQAAGRTVDHRADIYALGLTLFELLSGAAPYAAADPISLVVKAMQEPLPDLRAHVPGVPNELAQLVEQMGAKEPEQRIQSCEAVIAALDDLAARLPAQLDTAHAATDRIPPTNVHKKAQIAQAVAAAHPQPQPTGGRSGSKLGLVAGIGVAVLGLGVGGFLLLRPASPTVDKPGDTATPPVAATQAKRPKPPDVVPEARAVQPTPTAPALKTGPVRVAVLAFKNVGNDPALEMLTQGIGETAVNALSGSSKQVQLVERADIQSDVGEIDRGADVHFDKATVARLGKLEGVEFAVQGGFQKAAGALRITARFVRVENGEIVDTLTVTHAAKDVFGAQDAVASGLKDKLLALAARERK